MKTAHRLSVTISVRMVEHMMQFGSSRTAAHALRETERQCLDAKADISLVDQVANSVPLELHTTTGRYNFRACLWQWTCNAVGRGGKHTLTRRIQCGGFCGDHHPRPVLSPEPSGPSSRLQEQVVEREEHGGSEGELKPSDERANEVADSALVWTG